MATNQRKKLNALFTLVEAGTPLTSRALSSLGISSNLAGQYAKSGWLTRLGQGVYVRTNEALDVHRSLATLQDLIAGLHVGGKTALDWHGIRHYVSQRPRLSLYGWQTATLPAWFTTRFPAEYRRKRTFQEEPTSMLNVAPWRDGHALVSSPERAFLELLSEVGLRQTLQEARELAAGTHHLRAKVLQQLLQRCNSVKTVRLCLHFGSELNLPWAAKIDRDTLPTGGASAWVARSKEGLLVLK